MRYLSRDFVLISSIIFNLHFFYILLLQKEGCITTQYTPPPQSTPLTVTWSQRPTTLWGKDCSSTTFHTQACLCYNLGQNKMRNRSTPPPNSMLYSRYNENAPFFHHWNGGRGGLNFSSILSKIVGYPTFHKIKNYIKYLADYVLCFIDMKFKLSGKVYCQVKWKILQCHGRQQKKYFAGWMRSVVR